MKLNIKALTLTVSILCGGVVFLVGIGNLIWTGYGANFLQLVASIYPGYKAAGTFGDLIVGTLYALADGAILGLVFGLIYNLFIDKIKTG
jgi:ABC-type phosphate transport system permease subunit